MPWWIEGHDRDQLESAVRHRLGSTAQAGVHEAVLGRPSGVHRGRTLAGVEVWTEAQPKPPSSVSDFADHVDHLRAVAGTDHIGLGGDYDGSEAMPEGLEDVSRYPALLDEVAGHGYRDEDLMKITGRNVLRVIRDAEGRRGAAARRTPTVVGHDRPTRRRLTPRLRRTARHHHEDDAEPHDRVDHVDHDDARRVDERSELIGWRVVGSRPPLP